jgi:hypothetical protein
MIKEVLVRIHRGETLAEIERELGMEHSALLGMLDRMVKMGLLEMRERKPEEQGVCKTCPLREVCGKNGPKVYYLTEKGLRAINK